MKLIVGLGNPGEKYTRTRHNVGFMVMDAIASQIGGNFSHDEKFESQMSEVEIANDKIKLVKPQTFMNESGRAVSKIKSFWKIADEDIIIIHDDVDLEFGKIRIQKGGSSAGHKGVQSIIDAIGEDFWRVRIGVGKSEEIATDAWVLQNFQDEENLAKIIDTAADIVVESINNGICEKTINCLDNNFK